MTDDAPNWPDEIKAVVVNIKTLDKWQLRVSVLERNGNDYSTSLELLSLDSGLKASLEAWEELSRRAAQDHLARLLHKGQAYNVEIIPLEKAVKLAADWIESFKIGARYFTNQTNALDGKSRWWMPFTDATFDSGVAVIGPTHIGLIWFEDED